MGGLDKVRYTREGIEALIKQAEIDQDADQFVVSMKVIFSVILYLYYTDINMHSDCCTPMVDVSFTGRHIVFIFGWSSSLPSSQSSNNWTEIFENSRKRKNRKSKTTRKGYFKNII